MKATIQQLSGLNRWKDSTAIKEWSFPIIKGGMYMAEKCISRQRDESNIDGTSNAPQRTVTSRPKPLDETIRIAMKKSERDLWNELGRSYCLEEADFQNRVTIQGHEFATYCMSESYGVIFFQDTAGSNSLALGIICAIFLVRQDGEEQIFLAVHHYLMPPVSLPNPFTCYSDFGAGLWSSEMRKEVTIVPGNRDIYHAIHRSWDHKILVMKPLNRVSVYSKLSHADHSPTDYVQLLELLTGCIQGTGGLLFFFEIDYYTSWGMGFYHSTHVWYIHDGFYFHE